MAKERKRKKQNIPKDENSVDRFVRVVTPRVAKAVKSIRVVGYCAGAGYEYTPAQVQQITDALTTAIRTLQERFATKKGGQEGFAFKQ